ncbi:hypothetical protein Angca_001963, partial [Angiostrongylus cantonensis]
IQLNVNKTLEHIDNAEDYLSKLLELRNKLDSTQRNAQNDSHTAPPATNLPPIPIPNFIGDIWEWEAFWGEFEHSVHSRQMDDRLKMNYLLNSLHGNVRAFIKHYEISR